MTHPIPFAIDDLVVCDNSNWLSSFAPDAMGLPQVNARLGQRFGAWPVLSGLDRPGHKLTMTTIFGDTLTPAQREAARLVLLQKANYEREELKRLTAADGVIPGVAPSSVLLALGPWDVARSGSTYAPRDLLDQDTIGTVTGGVIWRPGRFGKAVQIAEATTNLISNPSFETNTTGWLPGAGNSITQSTNFAHVGSYSAKCIEGGGKYFVTYVPYIAGQPYILSLCARRADGAAVTAGDIYNLLLANIAMTTASITSLGDGWYKIISSVLVAAATETHNAGWYVGDGRTLYVDAVQVEQKAYATPYCDGSLGTGHSWSGTAHASTSSRTAASCKLTNPISTTAGTVALWWRYPNASTTTQTSPYLFSEGNLKAYYLAADDKLYFTDGINTISTAALTFSAWTWMHLEFTWASGALAIYINGASVATGATYTAPTLGAFLYFGSDTSGANQCNGLLEGVLVMGVALTATQVAALYANSLAADWKARWLNVKCEACQPLQNSNHGLVSTFAVDKEVRWRSRDGAQFWRVIAATGSFVVNNDGDDDAYPVIYITPKTAKTGNVWSYKRWIPVKWMASDAATNYPTDICNDGFDTQTLVTASKMQANGDDLRVKVDGTEVARWLDGINTATTKVWCNLNFLASQTATMAVIGDTTGTTLTSTTDITNWPSTGILYIDTEAITYTGKSVANKQFTGCTRGAKGTTAATHAASATAYWIQHDIWILYGNAGASAPTVDDNYKPAFELDHSTNTSWVYEVFGEDDRLRTAAWELNAYYTTGGGGEATSLTSANHGTLATPWTDVGIAMVCTGGSGKARLTVYNPCGITSANFSNGEYYRTTVYCDTLSVVSSVNGSAWATEANVSLTCDSTWRAWSFNAAITAGSKYVGFDMYGYANPAATVYSELADATLTLNSTFTPVVVLGAEQSNYDLAVTLTNSTTGESVQVTLTMQISQTLEIDTDNKTVILLADNSNQRQALTEVGGARLDWLRLVTGNNTLTWSDTGTVSVEVEILFDRRYIE